MWGVSRTRQQGPDSSWSKASLNGTQVAPPRDVQVIGGKLVEATNDDGWQTILAMYPKQPFNWAGRTGTVTFDVSDDSQGIHAAWPEFWITDQPVPDPNDYTSADRLSGHQESPRNGLGMRFAQQCSSSNGSQGESGPRVSVDKVSMVRNHVATQLPVVVDSCVVKGSAAAMNHVQVKVSATTLEVWASDAGSSVLRRIAHAAISSWPSITDSFTGATSVMQQGLIWIEDVHYNADKFNNQADHQFTWDNVGFDGPKTYRDLSFDAVDPSPSDLGYDTPATVTVNGVHRGDKTPVGAYVMFTFFNPNSGAIPAVSLNGTALTVPASPWSTSFVTHTIAIPVGPTQLALIKDGSNTLRFTGNSIVVSNVNIVYVNAQTVP